MNKSIEAIAAELEARGMICDRDDTRYHPLKVWSATGMPLAGIRFERGTWKSCLIWDDWLEKEGIDKEEFSQMIEEAIHEIHQPVSAVG